MPQDLPCPGPPHHIGDLPGENVITFGIVLPLSNPTANGLCGAPNIRGITTMEAVAWAISNARVIHSASSLKIGKHCQLFTATCGHLSNKLFYFLWGPKVQGNCGAMYDCSDHPDLVAFMTQGDF